jgi:hypothetical protein
VQGAFRARAGRRRAEATRWSEQLALEWKDADFLTGILSVTRSKNGHSRQVPMNSLVRSTLMDVAALRQRLQDPAEPIFKAVGRAARFFPRPFSEPVRPFVRRAGMRIACQGILGTRIDTPSRPGWSWPESTSGRSRSLAAGEPSAWSPDTVTSLLNFSGRRWSGSWGRGVVPWNYPETSPAQWHKLASTARCVTSN